MLKLDPQKYVVEECWRGAEPFLDSVVQLPMFWRAVGPLIVRWKRYEESHQPHTVIKSVDGKARFATETLTSLWWRQTTSRFSKMVTQYDYFWEFMCPRCSYDCDWVLESMEDWGPGYWYQVDNSGSYFNGDCTIHWFEGIVTCPRCLTKWNYGDSN